MNDEVLLLDSDSEPEAQLDGCRAVESLTPLEEARGVLLGNTIDPEDDDDDGLERVRAVGTIGDREAALTKARALKRVMLSFGVPEVSIELSPGRPNSYGQYDALYVVSEMSHHTVSRYSPSSLTPVLWLCKNGRSDLPGPLCNGYGGWDLCYRIITFGYANHSGYGGPFTVPALTAKSFTIPKDSARRYAWGTEWEGGIAESDWSKLLTNPRNSKKMTMREFMGRSNAALEEFHKIHEYAHLEHSTWTSRKVDRLNYTRAEGIAEKKPFRSSSNSNTNTNTNTNTSTQKDWFAMATEADLKKVIQESLGGAVIVTKINREGDNETKLLNQVLRELLNDEARFEALLIQNNDKLVQAIIDNLPQDSSSGGDGGTGGSGGLTEAQIQAAVERGIRQVLGSLNEEG